MFQRIKVVSALVAVLAIFTLLQVVSGGMFYHSVKNDRDNFIVSQRISNVQREVSNAFNAMLQARISLARAGTRFVANPETALNNPAVLGLLDQAQVQLTRGDDAINNYVTGLPPEKRQLASTLQLTGDYKTLRDALGELVNMLKRGDVKGYLDQPTQSYQDKLEKTYHGWLESNARLTAKGLAENQSAWEQTLMLLSGMAVVVLLVLALVWSGIYRILLRPLRDSIAHIRHIANGDLTQPIVVQGKNEMAQLASSLQAMQQALIRTVRTVRDGSDAIHSGAGEISISSSDLSARTEQQAASLEETAASMEQLTATVRQNADNARQASQLALSASETAARGGKVVDNVVQTMSQIAGSSKKIADITSVIDGIAFQTNILALNAAVEAARAGEQGRGFAVVAGEVRNLAQRSASAAKEIKSLIEESVSRVDAGAVLVESAGETMSDIVGAVTRVTDIMGEIASASDEQSRGIDQVNSAVTEMDRVTQQNASLVQESATAASALENQAAHLTQAVAAFQISKEIPLAAVNNTMGRPQRATLKPPVAVKALPVPARADENWETF